MAVKELLEKVVMLKETNNLTTKKKSELKEKYNSKDVDVVCACVTNDVEYLQSCIDKGFDLSICNGKVLRYTVSNGFVDLSLLLLKNKIEP